MSQHDEDIALLKRAIAAIHKAGEAVENNEADDSEDEAVVGERLQHAFAAFTDMLSCLEAFPAYCLSDRQRAWARGVSERGGGVEYENLVSSGKANLSSYGATPTPEVLKKALPMKPPRKNEKA